MSFRNKTPPSYPRRSSLGRQHGRITKEDICEAGLRRWDGKNRVTTDWVNLFQEPELCSSSGNLLIYLREPGQSSRGPSFRVHIEHLRAKGFHSLLENCVAPPPLPTSSQDLSRGTRARKRADVPWELYMPAPANSDLTTIFDHHITTRNFFAWIYNLPLAGRALGKSLVSLHERINFYRGRSRNNQTKLEIAAFAEAQRYLDFRECVDHALAALFLAEHLEIEDLWVDAFAHCVGMTHRSISESLEYPALSYKTRTQLDKARLDMDLKLDRVSRSVENFFERDVSATFLGFPPAARDHFDRFRSFLHGFYIEQNGFWPPEGFYDDSGRRALYKSMYSDFRVLYHHLVDPSSSSEMGDHNISAAGGVCILQNVKRFDARHHYESLPNSLPQLPAEPSIDARSFGRPRRQTWNPLTKKKLDRELRSRLRAQALITASNRDLHIMQCPLVRRFSEFESQSVHDASDEFSIIEGRKIRWIAVYAILQTLISVVQAPKQVRNTEGLSYFLCCHAPKEMPWEGRRARVSTSTSEDSELRPDTDYRLSRLSSVASDHDLRKMSSKERRGSLPTRATSLLNGATTLSRSSSLARFVRRSSSQLSDLTAEQIKEANMAATQKRASFCEIMVEGYGNGLNPVIITREATPQNPAPSATGTDTTEKTETLSKATDDPTKDDTSSSSNDSPSVSRESSNASTNSTRSKSSSSKSGDGTDSDTTVAKQNAMRRKSDINLMERLKANTLPETNQEKISDTESSQDLHMLDEFGGSIHINTRTWDEILGA